MQEHTDTNLCPYPVHSWPRNVGRFGQTKTSLGLFCQKIERLERTQSITHFFFGRVERKIATVGLVDRNIATFAPESTLFTFFGKLMNNRPKTTLLGITRTILRSIFIQKQCHRIVAREESCGWLRIKTRDPRLLTLH